MLGTTFIDFLMSNSTSVPVINALYTYGLSFLIHCWVQFADILFRGYSCSVLSEFAMYFFPFVFALPLFCSYFCLNIKIVKSYGRVGAYFPFPYVLGELV